MLRNIRKQYAQSSLIEENVDENPFSQFERWLNDAVNSLQPEPTAMVLSTVDENLQPHSRIVLLKELERDGFVFFTNYEGHKGKQISYNNKVSLLFFWPQLERQVRITGCVDKCSEELSDEYFQSRPYESRIGAWASNQSEQVASKQILEERYQYYAEKYPNIVPRPIHWGGYIVKPETFEFWQGQPNRMHDRILYQTNDSKWNIYRLSP